MKFTDCVKVAYPSESPLHDFAIWVQLINSDDADLVPMLHDMHRCVSECHEITVEASSTTLTPAGADPDDHSNGVQGATMTWTWRHLSITLYLNGTLLAEGDEEVAS